jgi:hypothetical protein
MSAQKAKARISVFISHRHVDKPIADLFCEAFEEWSNGEIDVYQSSSAEHASKISADLDEAIAQAIANASIVLLIYTEAPGDMDWCMYECGLAQDPTSRTTKVAVFHTTPEPPDPLDGLIAMRLDPESVFQFTWGFHKNEDFFPSYGAAFAPRMDDEKLKERSRELFEKLVDAAPEGAREVQVYDHFQLTMPHTAAQKLMEVAESKGLPAAKELSYTLLLDEAKVTSQQGDPQEHFAFDEFAPDMPLGKLVERWRKETSQSSGWVEELCQALTLAVLNRPELPLSQPFLSLIAPSGPCILPVLSSYRVMPYRKLYEFDVLLCQLGGELARTTSSGKTKK